MAVWRILAGRRNSAKTARDAGAQPKLTVGAAVPGPMGCRFAPDLAGVIGPYLL